MDGSKLTTINANGTTQWQKTFTSPIYAAGTHVVQIKHAGAVIDVDAIQILDTPVPGVGTYDDTDPKWYYAGAWSTWSASGPYNDSLHYTSTVGNMAMFTFSGTQFVFSYTQYPNRGSFDVYVDGSKLTTLNANGTTQWQKRFTSPLYSAGTHVVQIKENDRRQPNVHIPSFATSSISRIDPTIGVRRPRTLLNRKSGAT